MNVEPGGTVSGERRAAGRHRPRRSVIALAGVVAAAAAAAGIWSHVMGARPALAGAVLTPPQPAYDFRLLDQQGRPISLGALRGKAVALTFLYTHCPDVCPLIATKLREAYQKLGRDARRVAMVAVSVDPQGDTPAAVRAFVAAHHVERELHYLTGSFAQLRPIWAHYYVGTDAKEVNPEAVASNRGSPDEVGHTAIVYVIDPRGNLRVMLPGNLDPQDLVTDLRILASASGK